eukprot:RCo014766
MCAQTLPLIAALVQRIFVRSLVISIGLYPFPFALRCFVVDFFFICIPVRQSRLTYRTSDIHALTVESAAVVRKRLPADTFFLGFFIPHFLLFKFLLEAVPSQGLLSNNGTEKGPYCLRECSYVCGWVWVCVRRVCWAYPPSFLPLSLPS